MELILIRHGEAEELIPEMGDAMRNLTVNGRRKLKKTMPNLRLFIKKNKSIQIWSSPLLRATQTAKIVAKSFDMKDIELHEFIATGDFENLSKEMQNRKPVDYLLIIGHEPHLSNWSHRLCGTALPLQKGTSVGFLLESMDPLIGRLNWLLSLKSLKGLKD